MSFQSMAAQLVTTVHEIKIKRDTIAKDMLQDQAQIERLQSQLQIINERRQQICSSLRQHQKQEEQLKNLIEETEQTKAKIVQSLKFLNAHLKKKNVRPSGSPSKSPTKG